jgi:hypothetical protein
LYSRPMTGCPIQAAFWLEWDSKSIPITQAQSKTNVVLSAAKDLLFAGVSQK